MLSELNNKSKVLETILNILDCHVYWKNEQGHYLWCNKKLANVLDLKDEKDIIGKTDYELYSPELAQIVINLDKDIINNGREHQTEEIGIDSGNKKAIYLSIKAPIKDELGKVDGLIGISIDITERRQSEIAKQEFLMNMAHDLRTPLAGIIGLASIQAEQGTNAQARQHGLWILTAGEQLLELLNAVLKVIDTDQMTGSVKAEPIQLPQLAKELQSLMQPSIEAKKLEFELKLDSCLPVIVSDQIQLKRLLLNLLSNAVKFTKKGKISLEIELLSIKEDRAKIEIRIIDTGIGIEHDKINKIFDQFYRVHPSYRAEYKGYGIGLYLVKKSLELLDGKITVSSEEGKGSCFTLGFNFPLAEENVEHAQV